MLGCANAEDYRPLSADGSQVTWKPDDRGVLGQGQWGEFHTDSSWRMRVDNNRIGSGGIFIHVWDDDAPKVHSYLPRHNSRETGNFHDLGRSAIEVWVAPCRPLFRVQPLADKAAQVFRTQTESTTCTLASGTTTMVVLPDPEVLGDIRIHNTEYPWFESFVPGETPQDRGISSSGQTTLGLSRFAVEWREGKLFLVPPKP